MRFLRFGFCQAGRALAATSTLCHFLAASTLHLRELREGMNQYWASFYARDEDIASGLMAWEADLVSRFITAGDDVLLVGSGTGRDVIALVERGCRVTGVEPSLARDRAITAHDGRAAAATALKGFFEDIALSGLFDTVMFWYYSYTYIPEAHRRVAALRKAAAHLKARGHILLSYQAVPRARQTSGYRRRAVIALSRAMGALTRSDWRLEVGDHVRLVDIKRLRYHYWHDFQPEEIEAEVEAAGLRCVYRRDPPDDPVLAAVPR